MIKGKEFIRKVKELFEFLSSEFSFRVVDEKNRQNLFYDVRYSDSERVISISYENTEDYLQVIVFQLENGELPDYDDKTHTLHLEKLNSLILSQIDKDEIDSNNKLFSSFKYENNIEKRLLKKAKELRLCLKHFDKMERNIG